MNIDRKNKIIEKAFLPFITFHRWIKSNNFGTIKLHVLAYRFFGKKIAPLLPYFKDVDANLQKSRVKMSFRAYLSLAFLTTLLLSISILVMTTLLTFFIFHLTLYLSGLLGIGTGLLTGALTMTLFHVYPIIRADTLRRRLDDDLPFTAGYMMVLANAGVPPNYIFRSLAEFDAELSSLHEARTITRDVELFGVDVLTALKSASDRTPSAMFKELLGGFISTVHSGGSLVTYLYDRLNQHMKSKQIALRRFLDTLAIISEFYVALLVAGPLILVVMLTVMAMLGGGGGGVFNPRLLLYLLTYIGIPIGSVTFLIILDVISPRR